MTTEPKVLRAQALDMLDAALLAAEEHIFTLNYGVPGFVALEPGVELHWGKAKIGGEKQWQLFVQYVAKDPDHVSRASIAHRLLAAHALPKLLAVLVMQKDEELKSIHEATLAALAFSRGEHDSEPSK